MPSSVESAVFGTKICDLHVPVRPAATSRSPTRCVKRLLERGAVDDGVRRRAHRGLGRARRPPRDRSISTTCSTRAGSRVEQLDAFVDLYAAAPARRPRLEHGDHPAPPRRRGRAGIVNVGLARGNVGRDGAGLMPIRGHSGVQGGAEMGAYATALPGGLPVDAEHAAALGEQWGFDVPPVPGLTAPEHGRGRRARRPRRALRRRRQLPRGAARPGAGRRGAGPGAAAGPPGRDAVEPDAGRRATT